MKTPLQPSYAAKLCLPLLLLLPVTGCVESQFRLSRDAALPSPLTLPPGLTRADVGVDMTFHTTAYTSFVLKNAKGHRLQRFTGKVCKNEVLGMDRIVTKDKRTITVHVTPYQEHRGMEENGRVYARFDIVSIEDGIAPGCPGAKRKS